MRLIDADEAIEALMINKQINDAKNQILAADEDSIIEWLKKRPSAQPERIKGRWLRKESDLSWWHECSECGESPLFDPYEHEVRTPFCPWCGAELRGDEDAAD